MNNKMLQSGKAFVIKDNEKPVAYAVLVEENEGWVLKYIFTDKNERQKGYASYLIREIIPHKEVLLQDGSRCIPFREMDNSIRNQLISSPTSSFANTLNPAVLLQNDRNVDLSISTVLVKNGVLVAYSLITRPTQNTISIEQISETQNEIGMGIIVAPLCVSLEAIRKIPEITIMKMTISDSNKKSLNFVARMFKGQEISSTKNISFIITQKTL